MARAMNSGESSNRRMKALACFSTLAGTISAVSSSPNRKIGSRSLRLRLAASTSSSTCHCVVVGLRAVDGDQPAGLVVEDLDQPPRILVADAGDDAKPFLLDRGGKLLHAASGGMLAFVVLVDDGDRKRLKEFHDLLPARLDHHSVYIADLGRDTEITHLLTPWKSPSLSLYYRPGLEPFAFKYNTQSL